MGEAMADLLERGGHGLLHLRGEIGETLKELEIVTVAITPEAGNGGLSKEGVFLGFGCQLSRDLKSFRTGRVDGGHPDMNLGNL